MEEVTIAPVCSKCGGVCHLITDNRMWVCSHCFMFYPQIELTLCDICFSQQMLFNSNRVCCSNVLCTGFSYSLSDGYANIMYQNRFVFCVATKDKQIKEYWHRFGLAIIQKNSDIIPDSPSSVIKTA